MSYLLENHIHKNCHQLGDLINLGQSALAHYQKLSVLFPCGLIYELRTVNSDVYVVSQYMYMLTNHMYIPTLEADKTEGNPDNGLNKIMRLGILFIRRLDILTSLMKQSSPLFKSYIEVKPLSVRFKIAKNTSYGQSLD